MLGKKAFAEEVAKGINGYLAPEFSDVECEVMEPEKNNRVPLVGVCFRKPGQQAAPLVYMEPFYDAVREGKAKEEVMQEIARLAEKGLEVREIPGACSVPVYGEVKDCLTVRLVNTKANRQRLSHMPHRGMEDLSLTLALSLPLGDAGRTGSIEVTDEIMGLWGVDEETLFRQAYENMERVQPPMLKEMGTLFGMAEPVNLLAEDGGSMQKPEGMMFVLTNVGMQYGASAIACPGVMEKISRMFPEGFYILPSSVHEVLVVPKDKELPPKELGKMVREVNQTGVSREEVLSDRVYEYDKEKGRIRQVPDSIEKGRGMER